MRLLNMRLFAALVAVFPLTRVAHSLSSSLTAVDAFVSTSEDVSMFVYIPEIETTSTDTVPIVVAIHSCERTADYYYENTGYAALADQYGYLVIYPNASTPSGCWDTTSTASLTRNGGGDSQAIANMVSYAVKNFNGNASRVAVTGSSSGGIMVNLLAGLYPDVFQAASIFSGEYINDVYTYSGSRPKMMIYHGTADLIYPYTNLAEELNGWAKVLDVTFSQNVSDTPLPGYTQMMYGDGLKLVGVSAAGVGHTVPVNAVEDLAWFCIDPACDADGLPAASTTSTTSSSSSSTSSTRSSGTASSSLSSGATTTTAASATGTSAAGGTSLASETSTSTSPPVSESSGASSGLSIGAEAGIGAGAGAAVILLFALGACLIRKRRRDRSSEVGHKMIPLESDGHEYHSGYGVVPVSDARQVGDLKQHEAQIDQIDADPMFTPSMRPRVLADHQYRDSTTSSLFPPESPGADQRYSTTSSTMLLPQSRGEDQRFSYASRTTMLPQSPEEEPIRTPPSIRMLPRSMEGDEEQDISDRPYRP